MQCKAKLSGPGDREAAIRAPLENLLGAVGSQLGIFHDEVRDVERRVRPDYGVSIKGAITGYIEVKAPDQSVDPDRFSGHNKRQWERQRDLPNLVYTNGTEWRLYRDGELVTEPVVFSGGALVSAGADLSAPSDFEALLSTFLRWRPAPITSVGTLVRAVAPMTRLLRGEVLDQLEGVARDGWTAPLTPAADTDWDDYPALNDLMPWTSPGVKPNRTWVYAPSRAVLDERWTRVTRERDPATKRNLFKDSRDSSLDRQKHPLPGPGTYQATSRPFRREITQLPTLIRVGYRAFDRQWTIPDSRLIDQPRPALWAARRNGQIFAVEQHAEPISSAPGACFSSLVPDMHLFNGRGGRVLPLLHPDGSANVAPGLLAALAGTLECEVTAQDLLAYIGGVVAHPGYTETFADELTTPGSRSRRIRSCGTRSSRSAGPSSGCTPMARCTRVQSDRRTTSVTRQGIRASRSRSPRSGRCQKRSPSTPNAASSAWVTGSSVPSPKPSGTTTPADGT